MKKVAIAGVAQTSYLDAHKEWSLEELIFRTVTSLLKKVDMGIKEIESVIISQSDQVDGRAISIMVTSGPVGAYGKDLLNTPSAGEHALALAYLRVLSGMFDTSLVVGWNKCSEPEDLARIQNLTADYIYHRDLGMNDSISLALQAGAYMKRFDVPEEAAIQVVSKNRRNGCLNGLAHLRQEVAPEEIRKTPYVAWPLRQAYLPPESDGVCAMILASEEKVKAKSLENIAWIKGLSWIADTYWMGDRPLDKMTSLELAARKAYQMAGIQRPKEELDVIEIQEVTSYHELMAYEALGLCGPGEGWRLISKGETGFKGKIPVNPSGGALCSNPFFATGLVRVAEVALQIMEQAGKHQVPGVKLGLASASSGFACQNSSVFILSKEV
jgi:acetyl-CoA C-acetyltransferase